MNQDLLDTAMVRECAERYIVLRQEDVARERVECAAKWVVNWKYALRPRFPEIPFVDELYNGAWVEDRKDSFPHGFDSDSRLAFIKWHIPVVFEYTTSRIEESFFTQVGRFCRIQVVRHVHFDDHQQVSTVVNTSDYRSSIREYKYESGRLMSIIARDIVHSRFGESLPEHVAIKNEQTREYLFTYSPDGRIEAGPDLW